MGRRKGAVQRNLGPVEARVDPLEGTGLEVEGDADARLTSDDELEVELPKPRRRKRQARAAPAPQVDVTVGAATGDHFGSLRMHLPGGAAPPAVGQALQLGLDAGGGITALGPQGQQVTGSLPGSAAR